jgi:hypothetical protein
MLFGHYGSLKPMTGWIVQRLSAVRMRFRERSDLLLKSIVPRHLLAILQNGRTAAMLPPE